MELTVVGADVATRTGLAVVRGTMNGGTAVDTEALWLGAVKAEGEGGALFRSAFGLLTAALGDIDGLCRVDAVVWEQPKSIRAWRKTGTKGLYTTAGLWAIWQWAVGTVLPLTPLIAVTPNQWQLEALGVGPRANRATRKRRSLWRAQQHELFLSDCQGGDEDIADALNIAEWAILRWLAGSEVGGWTKDEICRLEE